MTIRNAVSVGALALTLGLATAALAKPDYLDRMNPAKPKAQISNCDCPMMGGGHAGACMAPTGPAPKGTPKG